MNYAYPSLQSIYQSNIIKFLTFIRGGKKLGLVRITKQGYPRVAFFVYKLHIAELRLKTCVLHGLRLR